MIPFDRKVEFSMLMLTLPELDRVDFSVLSPSFVALVISLRDQVTRSHCSLMALWSWFYSFRENCSSNGDVVINPGRQEGKVMN